MPEPNLEYNKSPKLVDRLNSKYEITVTPPVEAEVLNVFKVVIYNKY